MRPGPLLAARWQAVSPARRDVLLPALLALGSFVPGIAHNGVALGELPARAWDWWAVLLIGAQTLPLPAVRHRPYLTLAVVASAFAFYQCLGYSPAFGSLAILVAIGVAGFVHRPGRRAVAYLGTASYVVLSVILIARGSPERPIDFFTFFLALLVPWWVGRSWRTRNDAVALRAQHHATRAVEAERRRIAAELHDVVTHHVTAMVVQAGAANYWPPWNRSRWTSGSRRLHRDRPVRPTSAVRPPRVAHRPVRPFLGTGRTPPAAAGDQRTRGSSPPVRS